MKQQEIRTCEFANGLTLVVETMHERQADLEVGRQQVPDFARFLGGGLDTEAMRKVVEPELYRNRA